MGQPKLRATHCLHCGKELTSPTGKRARIDRTYCAESCRVLAYRVRRELRGEENSEGTPKRAETRPPLLHKALSALADLQAQIVGIGHSLREEDLADKKHRIAPDTVEHEAEAESLRKQIDQSGRLDPAYFEQTIPRLQPGEVYELMCHPGYRDPEEVGDPALLAFHGWDEERELLTGPGLRTLCAARGVRLVRFRDLEDGPGRSREDPIGRTP